MATIFSRLEGLSLLSNLTDILRPLPFKMFSKSVLALFYCYQPHTNTPQTNFFYDFPKIRKRKLLASLAHPIHCETEK